MRLTKDRIEKILVQNDGETRTTHYSAKNIKVTNHYRISDGKLYCREEGKGGYSIGRFDNETECDIDQTRRFLKRFIDGLNVSGIE